MPRTPDQYDAHYKSEKGRSRRFKLRIRRNFIKQFSKYGYKYKPKEEESR